jgi:hypothetical protein
MNMEDQVCSIKQAIKLKELGILQIGYFYWGDRHAPHLDFLPKDRWDKKDDIFNAFFYTAFTVAELGLMLSVCPIHFQQGKSRTGLFYFGGCYQLTEAQARAGTLIQLIETKEIKVEHVNQLILQNK